MSNGNTHPPSSQAGPSKDGQVVGGHSARYIRFRQAFEIAARKSNKWTLEHYAQCFPSCAAALPDAISRQRDEIVNHNMSYLLTHEETIQRQYETAERIDLLSEAVSAARTRAENGQLGGKDVWKPNIEPKASTRAHVVTLLREERDRLRKAVQEVDEQNKVLLAETEGNKTARIAADDKTRQILHDLDKAAAEFTAIPVDDMKQAGLEEDEDSPS